MLENFNFGLEDLDLDLDGIPDSFDGFIDLDGNSLDDAMEPGQTECLHLWQALHPSQFCHNSADH